MAQGSVEEVWAHYMNGVRPEETVTAREAADEEDADYAHSDTLPLGLTGT